MQGIEPKFHSNLTERMEHYRWLVNTSLMMLMDSPEISFPGLQNWVDCMKDYLITKRKLEQTIKNYRKYNNDLRKLLNIKKCAN